MQLANWEKKVIASKNNYAEEVLRCQLNEEKNQETSWHFVRENVVDMVVFASKRQRCVEVMTKFCSYYELDMKTIEASFVYLDRFLLLREAKTILESYSGVKGATGKHSLLAVAMCALMISSKYEEIYPTELISFARVANYSSKDFANLEVTLLLAMNWNLITTTPADYIGQFLYHANGANKTNFLLTQSIIENSWLAKSGCGNETSIFSSNNIRWLKSGQKTDFPACGLHIARPSEIALGCVILSLEYQGKICYPDLLNKATGVNSRSISHIVKQLDSQFISDLGALFS